MREFLPVMALRVIAERGLSAPDYYLLCTAGYRVTLNRRTFVEQAAAEFASGGWPTVGPDELATALARQIDDGLMSILTASDLQAEADRRRASRLPELDDGINYAAGHVDFTGRGYLVYREVITTIYGRVEDRGFNIDTVARRFDVYGVNAEDCERVMAEIAGDPAACSGSDTARIVGRTEPVRIGAWRPNRFIVLPEGHRATLTYTQ